MGKPMTDTTELSLYTQSYFNDNEAEIVGASRCGNVAELVEIANYIYVSVKASEYSLVPDDDRDFPVSGDPEVPLTFEEEQAIVQTDLDDLRVGTFHRYAMNVGQFSRVKNMQLTAGEWYDPYTFERWWDTGLAKERWRLILTREGTQALSIQVMTDAGAYWYTPGAFIDQGDGTWLINSWDGAGDTTGQQVNYQFIYGSAPISQILQVPGTTNSFESHISYGGSTPNE